MLYEFLFWNHNSRDIVIGIGVKYLVDIRTIDVLCVASCHAYIIVVR